MNIKIEVPQYITIAKQMELMQEVKRVNDEAAAIMRIIAGIPYEKHNDIKMKGRNELLTAINSLYNSDPVHRLTFELDGRRYGFIPNLDEITTGEYSDIERLLGDVERNMARLMAIYYRPIIAEYGKTYEIEAYEHSQKYEDAMMQADVNIFLGAQVFFYHLGNELSQLTLSRLEAIAKADMKKVLVKGGDLMRLLSGLQAVTQQKLNKSRAYRYTYR
jgi:hypothetical protein